MIARLFRRVVSSPTDDYTFYADDGQGIYLKGSRDFGLYLHIPFCLSLCPYCPYKRVCYQKDLVVRFVPAVVSEIKEWRERIGNYRFNSLYIGGGTPTLLLEEIGEILHTLKTAFSLNGPVAIETIPSDVTMAKARRMKQLGIEYISLGVQSLHRKYLRLLGRDYHEERARETIAVLTQERFRLLNVDLMFAYPGESIDELLQDLRDVAAYKPQQITCYPLFTFPYTAVGRYRQLRRLIMPPKRLRRRMYYAICRFLLAQGFRQSSVWGFTRGQDSPYSSVSRNYYVGLGPSAATYTGDAFYFNTFSVREYIKATPEWLPIALKMEVSHRLEKLFWLYWRLYEIVVPNKEYKERFKADFPWDFKLLLRLLKLLGFGRKEFGDRFVLSSRGAHWIHLLQNLYALNYVNTIWSKCQAISWPKKIKL